MQTEKIRKLTEYPHARNQKMSRFFATGDTDTESSYESSDEDVKPSTTRTTVRYLSNGGIVPLSIFLLLF